MLCTEYDFVILSPARGNSDGNSCWCLFWILDWWLGIFLFCLFHVQHSSHFSSDSVFVSKWLLLFTWLHYYYISVHEMYVYLIMWLNVIYPKLSPHQCIFGNYSSHPFPSPDLGEVWVRWIYFTESLSVRWCQLVTACMGGSSYSQCFHWYLPVQSEFE